MTSSATALSAPRASGAGAACTAGAGVGELTTATASGTGTGTGTAAGALRKTDAETCASESVVVGRALRARCSAAACVRPRAMGSGRGVADGGSLFNQAGVVDVDVDVPDVVGGGAGAETGVRRKGRRRAALNERPLDGEAGAGAGLAGRGADDDDARVLEYTWGRK